MGLSGGTQGIQVTLRLVGQGGAMVSEKVTSGRVTFGRVSLAGVSWAAWVAGIDAQAWVVREELREYSFYVINRHEGTAWLYGPNKGY